MPKFVMVMGKSPDACKIKTFHSNFPSKIVNKVKKAGYKVYYLKKCALLDADGRY